MFHTVEVHAVKISDILTLLVALDHLLYSVNKKLL